MATQRCHFIPGYLLERLAESGTDVAAGCRRTRELDTLVRTRRAERAEAGPAATATTAATGVAWQVHDAHNATELPGELVRSAGQPESGDVAVDEAAAGVEATLELLGDLGHSSYDDRGATVVATVHYERDYVNAFWDGRQLVFGDGDGKVFERFTKPVDVLGHELAHALTEHTANLVYADQPGALNESVSDVIGACVKQRLRGQTAAEGDWLIGEGLFLPGVNGRALRSMIEPGTAYDDPALGKDPQVGSMKDYIETEDDNGGVHLNSGIPNRAFVLAATEIGGTAWEGAGRIWYAALTSGIGRRTDFAGFAQACVAAAGAHEEVVRRAWVEVGVLGQDRGGSGGSDGKPDRPRGHRPLTVRRSGGFAGRVEEGTVDLDADDDVAATARALYDRVDLAAVRRTPPQPDRFVYRFETPERSASVGEPDLTGDLAELARLVLGEGSRF